MSTYKPHGNDTTLLDNETLSTLILFAFRYSLGRQSYAPFVVMEAIEENIDIFSKTQIMTMKEEIIDHLEEHSDLDMTDPFNNESHWYDFLHYLKRMEIHEEDEA